MNRFESHQNLHPALKKHVLFTEFDHVRQICSKLDKINIKGFFYIRRFFDGSLIDLSNNLDWAEFFFTQYFQAKYTVKDLQHHIFLDDRVNLELMSNLVYSIRRPSCFSVQ
jgi:hypothetical protein